MTEPLSSEQMFARCASFYEDMLNKIAILLKVNGVRAFEYKEDSYSTDKDKAAGMDPEDIIFRMQDIGCIEQGKYLVYPQHKDEPIVFLRQNEIEDIRLTREEAEIKSLEQGITWHNAEIQKKQKMVESLKKKLAERKAQDGQR